MITYAPTVTDFIIVAAISLIAAGLALVYAVKGKRKIDKDVKKK